MAFGQAIPYVNKLANLLTGYKQPSKDVQNGIIYPGDKACRVGTSPHAKWHESREPVSGFNAPSR